MQPDPDYSSQGFVDQPLPTMPALDGEEQQHEDGEKTAGTDEGDAPEAPIVDEPTA